jgi:hypothetical protein
VQSRTCITKLASDNSLANLQNRNVPIQLTSDDELVHGPILSKRISKKKVEELAIQKYRICGKGILFFMTKCVNLTDISTITQNVLLRFHRLYYLAK